MDPKLPDAEKIRVIYALVLELKRNLESAMPRDEDNNIDYTGHRRYHREQEEKEKEDQETKLALKKNLLTWASIGILTILGSLIAQAYILPILSIIPK